MLTQALAAYPLYDPPHKVEERLLSKERAKENFDYFLRVRRRRAAHFRDWLQRHFGVTVTFDEQGIQALSRWGNEYAGFLLDKGPDGHPTMSYFAYDPPWTNGNVGLNMVFDIGIMLGEATIAKCPKLRWDVDPFSAVLPNEAKLLKKTPGMSFRRPLIVGFDNPLYRIIPLHDVYMFAVSMMRKTTTVEGMRSFRRLHRYDQRLIQEALLNTFKSTIEAYPEGDPVGIRRELGSEEYLKALEDEAAADTQQGDDSDER